MFLQHICPRLSFELLFVVFIFWIQRLKEAEAKLTTKIHEFQADLTSRDELQRKLERKVLFILEVELLFLTFRFLLKIQLDFG